MWLLRGNCMKKILLMISASLLLNACASTNSQFDCPMKPGIRCESIDSVNARIDRGEIGGNHLLKLASSNAFDSSRSDYPHYLNMAHFGKGEPLRYGETVMRVWVAPFEDKEGNYHQESDIFTITKPGHWIGAPLKTTNIEEE